MGIFSKLIESFGIRLLNKHTLSGLTIVFLWMESQGLLPQGSANILGAIPIEKLFIWVGLFLGFYFIIKAPDYKNNLSNLAVNKAKNEADIKEHNLRKVKAIIALKEITKNKE